MRSRLSRRLEQQSKNTLALTAIGTLIVIGLLVKFGVPFIATLTYTLAGSKNNDTGGKTTTKFIASPVLMPTFDATNSATITIKGTSVVKDQIKLYVNGEEVDSTQVSDDNTFSFESVRLASKENTIKAKIVTKDGKESDFSNSLSVTKLDQAPSLTIDSPSDGQTYNKDDTTAQITGTTDPGVKVTVNGLWAIVDDSGKYSYDLPLKDGDIDIKVIATDEAGNTTEKDIKIKRST